MLLWEGSANRLEEAVGEVSPRLHKLPPGLLTSVAVEEPPCL